MALATPAVTSGRWPICGSTEAPSGTYGAWNEKDRRIRRWILTRGERWHPLASGSIRRQSSQSLAGLVRYSKSAGFSGESRSMLPSWARRFGIERSWVYSHAIELGVVKLGSGSKPRLRFDPEVAAQVLRRVGERPADSPARSGKRASQPQGSKGKAQLLPIRRQGENLPPSAA
jgi:hypothetical protein